MERKFKAGNTTYQRSTKYGVGKEIGGKIYLHKNYFHKVISPDLFLKAASLLPYGFVFNCLVINRKRPNIVRFDEAPDFDTSREPHPGRIIEVDVSSLEIRETYSDYIWHHKWMWVSDDYKGFDVNASYEWSKKWTSVISHPSGSKRIWDAQLEKANLI